jgi:hypothetical protein
MRSKVLLATVIVLAVAALLVAPIYTDRRAREQAASFCTSRWTSVALNEVLAAARSRGADVDAPLAGADGQETYLLRFQGLLANMYDCVLIVRNSQVVGVNYNPTTW